MRRCDRCGASPHFQRKAISGVLIMNKNRFAAAFAFAASISLSTVYPQPATQPKPQAPPAAQNTTVAVPVSKIAVIYSEAFQDPKTGIARFTALLNSLNREFQPRQTDL